MEKMNVDGVGIAYELLGNSDAPTIALTPGGRFTMDVPGYRDMAEAFTAAGYRVLIYDRPNCGYSDTCLLGESESENQAEALAGLIRKLELGPVVIAGGSGGSRVSLLAASRYPELCSHLVLWWISGDPIGLMQLATYYCGEAATLASAGGMEAVLEATSWAEHLAKNPAARAALLAMDPDKFIAVMQKWAAAYAPSELSPVPGMQPRHFAVLNMPTLVFRSGKSDLSHTRATSEWIHRLVPHSLLWEPPWQDDEWNYRSAQTMAGTDGHTLFRSWPTLVPGILEFLKSNP